jgi:hypothetical protein
MKALISPDEKIYDLENNVIGDRVAYFYDETFDVAQPLFFVDVDDTFAEKDSQFYYYNTLTSQVSLIPQEIIDGRAALLAAASTPQKTLDQMVEELVMKKLTALANNTN